MMNSTLDSLGNGLWRATLGNGLVVLLREMHHAPVTSFWIWYRVGSRVEQRPRTGLTHWVEHMLFRGTERFPGPSVHKLIAREGGTRNGFTSNDYTAYYETLPAHRLDLALQLEADRMVNARFSADDVEAERTIILSERAGRENQASYRLREAMLAAAFPNHGYGHPIIGYAEDLRRISRDELWRHYQDYYGPDNAVAVISGDVDAARMAARVEQLFGEAAPRRHNPTAAALLAASQSMGPGQRIEVTGPEPVAYVQMLFPAVQASDPDYFPLLVLDTILGGAKSMSFSGGGGANRSSRLYRALVNTELAASAGASVRPTLDPFSFALGATVRHGIDPHRVEDALWSEIGRVTAEPVDSAELSRAVKQTLAKFAFSADSVSSQGYWLGFSEVVASLDWYLHFPQRLGAVTADDVQRVAQTYLRPEAATVGCFVPQPRERRA